MPRVRALAVSALTVTALSGCSSDTTGDGSSAATYDIKAGNSSCKLEAAVIDSGDLTFSVHNTGTDVTEVYVYAKSGSTYDEVVGEVENVGPGTTQNLSVALEPGRYQIACKPGMTGDGIRTTFKVTAGQRG